jgi:predicted Zn-dependent protease
VLKNIIHSYQTAKLAVIKKFSDQNYDILDEPGFLDDGYIITKIQLLKKEYSKVEDEVQLLLQYDKKDDHHHQKLSNLSEYKDDLLLQLSFLFSNSINNIDHALRLIEGIETDFQLCLQALLHYKNDKETDAAQLFSHYFQHHPEHMEHFLINKVYGELLYKQGSTESSLIYLKKAIEKRPDDLDTLRLLYQAYQSTGNAQQMEVLGKIIDLLGGGEHVHG